MPSRGTKAARARAVGMGVAVAALLVACSGNGSSGPTPPTGIGTVTPRPTSTASPTPSETPAPDTTPPERPPALTDDGADGAEATAQYFLQVFADVHRSHDLTEWQALSHPECVYCTSVSEGIGEAAAAGERTTGGQIATEVVSSEEFMPGGYVIGLQAVQEPWSVRSEAGDLIDESPGVTTMDLEVVVIRLEDRWVVRSVDVNA